MINKRDFRDLEEFAMQIEKNTYRKESTKPEFVFVQHVGGALTD